jgi:hypothetical protein
MKTSGIWGGGDANMNFDDMPLQARYQERKSQAVIVTVVIALLLLGSAMISMMMR